MATPTKGTALAESEWFDFAGAAKHCGITVRHLKRLKGEGRIPFYKPGKPVRFRREDLDAFLEACRVESSADMGSR